MRARDGEEEERLIVGTLLLEEKLMERKEVSPLLDEVHELSLILVLPQEEPHRNEDDQQKTGSKQSSIDNRQ